MLRIFYLSICRRSPPVRFCPTEFEGRKKKKKRKRKEDKIKIVKITIIAEVQNAKL